MTIIKNQQRFVALGLLGASVALSGCITTGNFDASKSFIDTYAAWDEENGNNAVTLENKPSGSVSYSGGFAVERTLYEENQAPRSAGEPLAAEEPYLESEYIVGQLDIDVAFDDDMADFEASNFKRVTSQYSLFPRLYMKQSNAGGNAIAPIEGISEADITVGDSIGGTLAGTGPVWDGGQLVNVFGYLDGELTDGSGESAEALWGDMTIDTYLYDTPDGQFLLGRADLYIYPESESYEPDPSSPVGDYFGAAYAEEQ